MEKQEGSPRPISDFLAWILKDRANGASLKTKLWKMGMFTFQVPKQLKQDQVSIQISYDKKIVLRVYQGFQHVGDLILSNTFTEDLQKLLRFEDPIYGISVPDSEHSFLMAYDWEKFSQVAPSCKN